MPKQMLGGWSVKVCVGENVNRLDLMVESCGRDLAFVAIYTQSPVLDSRR